MIDYYHQKTVSFGEATLQDSSVINIDLFFKCVEDWKMDFLTNKLCKAFIYVFHVNIQACANTSRLIKNMTNMKKCSKR